MDINSWKMVTDIWIRYSTKWDTNQTLNLLNSCLGGMPMNDSARMTKPQVRDSRWYHILSMLRTKVWYFITTYMYFIFENYLNKVFLHVFVTKNHYAERKFSFFCLKQYFPPVVWGLIRDLIIKALIPVGLRPSENTCFVELNHNFRTLLLILKMVLTCANYRLHVFFILWKISDFITLIKVS